MLRNNSSHDFTRFDAVIADPLIDNQAVGNPHPRSFRSDLAFG